MAKRVVLIGLDNFGTEIARSLTSMGWQVIAADRKKERILNVKDEIHYTRLLDGDSIDELKELEIERADAVVVVVSDDLAFSMACIILLNQLKAENIHICVENENQEKIIRTLGNYTFIRSDQYIAHLLTEKISSSLVH